MIRHNDPERLEVRLGVKKRLKAQIGGTTPSFAPYEDSRAEIEGVANELAARLKDGIAPESLAVLATSHSTLKATARVLRQRHIPHRLSSSINIFEQPEIVQLWHLLRWIGMAAEDEAITQLLLGPFVDWPSDRVRQIVETARNKLVATGPRRCR
jgi:ATP-dependent exoDNAse (exonuclease V) beta subunit